MQAKINLVTIWTDNIERLKAFYTSVIGFEVHNDLGSYVEFKNDGVRFAICEREVMHTYSDAFKLMRTGQAFELAFPCNDIEDLDKSYEELIGKGAVEIHKPQNMPWNQRTALFADPDGNIHELFCELEV